MKEAFPTLDLSPIEALYPEPQDVDKGDSDPCQDVPSGNSAEDAPPQ